MAATADMTTTRSNGIGKGVFSLSAAYLIIAGWLASGLVGQLVGRTYVQIYTTSRDQ